MAKKTQIYLDYNATAALRPAARDAMLDVLNEQNCALNASSVHAFGRKGRKIVEGARGHVANLIGVPANQVIFNSGATEGNNTVLRYFAQNYSDKAIFVSSIEHPSVLDPVPNAHKIPCKPDGTIDINALDQSLEETRKTSEIALVSVMWVNNETGAIQDVSKISTIAHKHGALFHCDAVQAAGRLPVNLAENGIDFLTLSAHKIGGPQGAGALAFGLCGETPTLLFGGGQEKSARAGTENVAAIAGFGAAAKDSLEHMNHYQALGKWRDKLEDGLKSLTPSVIIHAEETPRVPNTSFFSLPDTSSETLLMALDLEGIALSNGSACSSGRVEPSHVLKAMGADEKTASSALRISMGWATKESDIDTFLTAWKKITERIKNKRK